MVVGFLVKKYFGTTAESIKIIGIASIFFGILLIVADSNPVKDNFPTYKNSIIIGLFQCMAFIPGASRSGTCITAARFCGLSRTEATRFSFLMAIPTILGACTLVALDTPNFKELFTSNQLILMGVVAGLGILTVQSLLRFLRKFSFISFGIYRIIFGIFLLWFLCA
jgi:undecaprenyl-diphosphatase